MVTSRKAEDGRSPLIAAGAISDDFLDCGVACGIGCSVSRGR